MVSNTQNIDFGIIIVQIDQSLISSIESFFLNKRILIIKF